MPQAVDFTRLGPKATFYWRLCIQQLLAAAKSTADVKEVFSRLSGERAKPLALTVSALLLFVRTRVGPWLSEQPAEGVAGPMGGGAVGTDELLKRLRVAEKVLSQASVKGEAVAATFGN